MSLKKTISNNQDDCAMSFNQSYKSGEIEGSTRDAQRAALYFLKLIMSNLSVEEEQREAIYFLKSNYDLLINVLKRITETSLPVTDGLMSDTRRNHTTGNSSAKSNSQMPHAYENAYDPFQNYSKVIAESTATIRSYPKRKRRSKYYDIEGDLSHIRRDPKCLKHDLNIQDVSVSNREMKRVKEQEIKNNEDIEINRQIARKLLNVLIQSDSKKQQESVLSILRNDKSIREVFLEEKSQLGKQRIPVYKTTEKKRFSQSTERSSCDDRVIYASKAHTISSYEKSSNSEEMLSIPTNNEKTAQFSTEDVVFQDGHIPVSASNRNINKVSLERELESVMENDSSIETISSDIQQMQPNSEKVVETSSFDEALYSHFLSIANECNSE